MIMSRTIGIENPDLFNNSGGPVALIHVKYSDGSGVVFKGAHAAGSKNPEMGPRPQACVMAKLLACSSKRSTAKSSLRMGTRLFHGNCGCARPNMLRTRPRRKGSRNDRRPGRERRGRHHQSPQPAGSGIERRRRNQSRRPDAVESCACPRARASALLRARLAVAGA